MNNEVNKKNAELFEALFGSEMQSKEIKMKQMQERQLKPFTILVIEDLFAILKRIFTSIIPFAIILIKALNYDSSVNLYKYILTSGFKITLFAFCSYAALTVLDTLITIVVGVIYSAIVAKRAKKMEFLKSKIKTKLEEQDKKDSEGIKEFSKDELDIINKAKELTKQYEEKVKNQKQTTVGELVDKVIKEPITHTEEEQKIIDEIDPLINNFNENLKKGQIKTDKTTS